MYDILITKASIIDTAAASIESVRTNRRKVLVGHIEAARRAFTDIGRDIPDQYRWQTVGARNIDRWVKD